MDILIVRDNVISDNLHTLIENIPHVNTCREVILSDFILAHGLRYHNADGCFHKAEGTVQQSSNWKASLLLNRVVEISVNSCAPLADGGVEPSRGQVSQAYAALLSSYQQPFAPTQQYSTIGILVPLFTQWNMVKKAIPGISLPQFKYGYGPELVDASDIEAPIFKSPFDLYTWRPNTPTEKEDPVDVFVVDRPRGRPLNAFFCGQHVGMKWLDEPSDVDANTRTSLTPLVLGVKDVFTAFIGETLWFVHGNEITFASFSHHAFAAQRYSELKELVTTVLEDNNCKASDTGWN